MSDLVKEAGKLAEEHAALKQRVAKFQELLREQEESLAHSMKRALSDPNLGDIDKAKLAEFLEKFAKRPYAILQKTENQAIVACPIHIPLVLGWLIKQDGAYNLWQVNKFVPLFQSVPQSLLDELNFQPAFNGITVEGGELRIERPDLDDPQEVFKRYRKHLSQIEDTHTIRVKPNAEFELIAALIRDGVMPFSPRPVAPEDLRDITPKIQLRDYQQRDYDTWLDNGVVGLMYPMGAGKSFVPLYAMDKLKGKTLVMVKNKTLREQWLEYIREWTSLTPEEYLVVVYHKSAMKQLQGIEFTLIIFDECHTLGANTFLQFTTLIAKYRFFLTGTPWREDGRHELVLAIMGLPLGVDWGYFLELGIIKQPVITVWVVQDQKAKLAKLAELLQREGKTLVFCDSLALGEKLSQVHGIPFVSGKTQRRLEVVRGSRQVIISRVGDLGLSLKDLDRVIEIDFLYGSRTQEAQRIGRLHHAAKAGEHFLIMSAYEYARYQKRLWGVESKGFKVNLQKAAGVDKHLEYASSVSPRSAAKTRLAKPKPVIAPKPSPSSVIVDAVKAGKIPFLSDLDKPDKPTILKILGCPYARLLAGLRFSDVYAILDHFFIIFNKEAVRSMIKQMYKSGRIKGRRVSKAVRRYFYEGD